MSDGDNPLEWVSVQDIADELGRRGLHGVLAVDDLKTDDGSEECGGGVFVIGHPTAAVGMADEAIRRARSDVDGLLDQGGGFS